MEKFKAVEKAMKTKAYSKEGLSAAAKLDPKEQAKVETCEFLSGMVDELEHQVEALEAESESIQATMKKGKSNKDKAERVAEIERVIERHKWHQGKLELIRRSLENGGLQTEQVRDLEETIRYYVSDGMNEDFMEDEEMYEDLELDGGEDAFGMGLDNEKGSTEDTRSTQDDVSPDHDIKLPPKPRTAAETAIANAGGRRPSTQLKSPLPTLATLHTPAPASGSGGGSGLSMKPASLPTRPAGEGLKYASAAAAAAASEKNVGIAPLPPPPGMAPVNTSGSQPQSQAARSSAASSPAATMAQPAAQPAAEQKQPAQPASAEHTPSSGKATPATAPTPQTRTEPRTSRAAGKAPAEPAKGLSPPFQIGTTSPAHPPYPPFPHSTPPPCTHTQRLTRRL